MGQVSANFKSDTTKGCTPVTINFQNLSTGNGLSYKWTFGNGNTSTLANPQAIYYQPGKYEVQLEITDASNKTDKIVKTNYIEVFRNPIAQFSGAPLTGCIPLNSVFTHSSQLGDGPITSWIWDFGDGNTTKDSIAKHTYNTSGKFNVSLVVKDINSCESKTSKVDYVEVYATPDIDIGADNFYYCIAPFTVNFTDKSNNTTGTDSYFWEFGDGSTSSVRNPSYTYTKSGTFNVSLTVTKPNGCKAKKTFDAFIKIGELSPNFSADKTKGCIPTKINFTNSTSPTSKNITFEWDFGDGTQKSGLHVDHEYKTAGVYTVTLKATLDNKCKESITKTGYITIEQNPIPIFTLSDSLSCKTPFNIIMTSSSQYASNINWLADGKLLGNSNPMFHSFTSFGNHTIELIATNFIGCKTSLIKNVDIIKPIVEIFPSTVQGCAPLTVVFKDKITTFDSVIDRFWTFGEGSYKRTSDSTVSFTYTKDSTYDVKLAITTKNGCTAESTVKIKVGLKTNPSFVLVKDTVCNKSTYQFKNTTDSKGVKIDDTTWYLNRSDVTTQFSNKSDGTLKADHDSGWYNVILITQNNGCIDTFIGKDQIFIAPPKARIDIGQMELCFSDSVMLQDKSVGADSIVWYVSGPGKAPYTISNAKNITIYRNQNGAKVRLVAFNFQFNCRDTIENQITFPTVQTKAVISYYGKFCAPSTITFDATTDASHNYFWYLGTDSAKGPTFVKSFDNAGNYAVKLIVRHKTSACVDSTTLNFNISGPSVSGELIGNDGCSPVAIQLKCNSDPKNYASLYWLIDTDKVLVTKVGTVNYVLNKPGPEQDGSYKIKLIGIDSNGCQGLQEFRIKVDGVLGGDIKIRRFADCSGLHYIFQTLAPGQDLTKLKVNWDFGDGNSSTDYTNNKIYATSGVYNLVLTIKDTNGCVSKIEKIMDIEKEKTYANFKADSLSSNCPPLFVQFKDISTASGRRIIKWFWEFGDGSTSIEQNPSKLYLYAGKFTVKLFVTDELGCKDSAVFNDFVLVNGPTGSYNFDKKEGCAPLTVNFNSNNVNAAKLEFDMGDGNVKQEEKNPQHIYTLPGRYIPLMVISDTFGCTYTMPPIDTIYVYPYPQSSFTYIGTCYGYPVQFNTQSLSNDTTITAYLWEFLQDGNRDTSTEISPVFTFPKGGVPTVKLTTVNKAGCSNTFSDQVRLKVLNADFLPVSKYNCVGNQIKVSSNVLSDTTIQSYRWDVEGNIFSDSFLNYTAPNTGPLSIRLIVTNSIGCSDTMNSNKIIIGDTTQPLDLEMLRITVVDDYTLQLDHKKSVLPDFESYSYYRKEINGFVHIGEQTDRNITTLKDYSLNSLSNVYCYKVEVRNSCGLLSDTLTNNEHCSVETKAVGGINHALVTWNYYKGWNEIEFYEIWREDHKNLGTYHYLDKVPGNSNQYTDSNVVCHISHHYKIRAVEQLGNLQESFSDTAEASPIWINTVPPNELVRASVVDDKYTTIDWDSCIKPKVPIVNYIIEKSDDGITYSFLGKYDADEFTTNDKKVYVDDQSYFYRTFAIDECGDTSGYDNFGKTILLKADTTGDQRPFLNWSTYQGWHQGVDYYSFEILNPDGSFTSLGTTQAMDTSWVDNITNLNQRPEYCYRIIGHRMPTPGKSEVVSVSNVDCSPVYSKIWVPNAFTPNKDNLNEKFKTPGIYIVEYHLMIFNRWGEKIFESFDFDDNWDGTYNGEPCQQDAYAVVVETIGVDRISRTHFGTVTLLR